MPWDLPRPTGEPSLGRAEFAGGVAWDVSFGSTDHLERHLLGRSGARNGLVHCLAQVPALCHPPDFNLEQELVSVSEFVLDPAAQDQKRPVAPRRIGRGELAAMAAPAASAAGAEHEEE